MDTRNLWRLVRTAQTFAVLSLVWLMFSWSLAPTAVVAGVLFSALIAAASYDVFIEEHEAGRHSVLPRALPAALFLFTLVASMYASSFRMLRSVATGRIDPRIVHFRSKLRSDLARVALAESITFTPGTITIDLDDDHFIVHWLNASTRHSSHAGIEIKGRLEDAIRKVWV